MTWFGVERSKVEVKVRVRVRRGFELYECLLQVVIHFKNPKYSNLNLKLESF